MVVVRLSQISPDLREAVADQLERRWIRAGVRGEDLLRLRVAARDAFPDAELEVPAEKAWRVLIDGKQPKGPTPTWFA